MHAMERPSFQGITVGQPIFRLPFPCTDIVFCEGVVNGYHLRIMVLKSSVLTFDVIYKGKSFSNGVIDEPPISLAQAVKMHSMNGSSAPTFGYALDKNGTIYGLVDLMNNVIYTTSAPLTRDTANVGKSFVINVSYVGPKAPVVKSANTDLLASATTATLLSDAQSAPLYSLAQGTDVQPARDTQNSNDDAKTESQQIAPFGLEPGMLREQVLKIVGLSAVKKDTGSVLILDSAPKPHPDFNSYVLLFSPTKGLIKIMAYSKDISTNSFGDAIRSKFAELDSALKKRYGEGTDMDFLQDGSLWTDPQYWMIGLLKQERHLTTYWNFQASSKLKLLSLEAQASNTETGQIVLSYEFEGFQEWIDSQKKRNADVF